MREARNILNAYQTGNINFNLGIFYPGYALQNLEFWVNRKLTRYFASHSFAYFRLGLRNSE